MGTLTLAGAAWATAREVRAHGLMKSVADSRQRARG
jgi:hypothetical protein